MKFKFKGIYSFDEEANNNYVGAAPRHAVIREFASLSSAIAYVNENNGFLISEDGKFAFRVLTIEQAD